jgi:polyisoprenoid-binding protein YceI
MSNHLHRTLIATFTVLTLAAGVTACDNPAADAPAAEVGEATDVTAAPADRAAADTYTLTDDSQIEWTASKVTRSHDGTFPDVEGTISLVDGAPEASSVEVTIDTTTLTSDTDQLTTHLKSADFFDVEVHPEASFRSTSITPQGDGTYQIAGVLEMHGVSKEVRFPATIEIDDDSVRTQAEFSINRFDWEIDYEGAADDLIRDEVLLKFDLRGERSGGEAAAVDV